MENKIFGNVCIRLSIPNQDIHYIDNEIALYNLLSNDKKGIVEFIAGKNQKVKPFFDLDQKEFDINIQEFIADLKVIFPDKKIKYCKRKPRPYNGKMKYSYRVYVMDTMISRENMIHLCNHYKLKEKYDAIDFNMYKGTSVLHIPNTKYKYSKEKGFYEVPKLELMEDASLFDCCASFIEEYFDDWDLKIPKIEIKIDEPIIKYKDIDDDNDEEFSSKDKYNYEFILEIINNLKNERAKEYDDWINVVFSIIGAGKKSSLSKKTIKDLVHHFSKKHSNYEEDKVEEWLDTNLKKQLEKEKTYGYRQLIHTYLKEDNPTFYETKFNKDYDSVKKKLENRLIKCVNDGCFIELNIERDEINNQPFFILSREQLNHKFCDNHKYLKKIQRGKNISYIETAIIDDWIKDENKKKCYNLCFKPYKLADDLNQKHFNLFRGYRASKLPICKDYNKCNKILFHLKNVICNNDEYIYKWMLQYLKAILNGKRTNVMIMIKGLEGCGKNIFINMFAYGIIGKEYSVSTSIPEKQFFGQFNSSLQNRCLAIINEGRNGLRDCIDRIKDFITEETISIERKGKEPIILDNYCNVIGDTNNWNILNISSTDRRFVWLECNNQYIGNKEYFDLLADDCKDDECLSALYHYIIEEVETCDIDFQKTRPITAVYKKLQRINIPNPIKFLINLFDNNIEYHKYQGKEFIVIKCNILYEQYKQYCSNNKYEIFTKDQFECKITEKEDNGIMKGLYRNFKVFRIYKKEFEEYIKTYNDLEYLEDFTDECDGFILDEDD